MNHKIINSDITDINKYESYSTNNYKILTTIYDKLKNDNGLYRLPKVKKDDNYNKSPNGNFYKHHEIINKSSILLYTYRYNNIYSLDNYNINYYNSFLIILDNDEIVDLLYNKYIFRYNYIKDIRSYIKKLYNKINRNMSIKKIINMIDINKKFNNDYLIFDNHKNNENIDISMFKKTHYYNFYENYINSKFDVNYILNKIYDVLSIYDHNIDIFFNNIYNINYTNDIDNTLMKYNNNYNFDNVSHIKNDNIYDHFYNFIINNQISYDKSVIILFNVYNKFKYDIHNDYIKLLSNYKYIIIIDLNFHNIYYILLYNIYLYIFRYFNNNETINNYIDNNEITYYTPINNIIFNMMKYNYKILYNYKYNDLIYISIFMKF